MSRNSFAWNRQGEQFMRDQRFVEDPKARAFAHGGDTSFYNRKAFAWNTGAQQPGTQPVQHEPPPRPTVASPAGECLNRIYEVVTPTATVRVEPHTGGKLKGKKSRGGRIICSEVTMNGWVKLANEPGWVISHMQGVEGTAEVAQPVDGTANGLGGPVDLAVPEYQPQGLCCLEVVAKSGVPVRGAPSKDAQTLATRRQGEFVFVQTQNFDGWVRCWGEDGWMLANHKEWGALLRPRSARGVDLWALGDAWSAARRARGGSLSPKDVADLKDLERRMLAATCSLWDQHATEDRMQDLVETGLLSADDLKHSEHWAFQRLFAGVLRQAVQEGEAHLRDLLPGFKLSERVPPLWGAEDDLLEEADQWEEGEEDWNERGWDEGGVAGDQGLGYDPNDPEFEGTTPVQFNGKTYVMFPNGVIFDPPNQTPIGMWNTETNKIEPCAGMVPGCPYAALSYFGKTYLLMPDGKLLEPETQKVVGSFDRNKNELNLDSGDPQKAVMDGQAPQTDEPSSLKDPVFDDDEPVDPEEYMERGHQMVKAGQLKSAVALYGLALQGCSKQKSVDMSFECEILRARAACFLQLGSNRELKEDAERILGCFPNDAEAGEWKRRASDGIRRAKFGLDAPAGGGRDDDNGHAALFSRDAGPSPGVGASQRASCPQCNGLASKCARCGAGMQRCAYCAEVVSKANCCSRCHCTFYCGRECQRAHWKTHKLECKSSEE